MKKIVLICDDGLHEPERFIVEIDEITGDAQIVNERAPRIERDTSARLEVWERSEVSEQIADITLTVEAA